jgi:hypothetical protein
MILKSNIRIISLIIITLVNAELNVLKIKKKENYIKK